MIKRIELTNFMSHAHTVIEPAAGLTVLVGPNNCGKSAVVAALQILCHNDNSTYVTRHGERECRITLETSDGHVVRWKRKAAPSYEIDGQLFDRLRGTGLPEQLHQALRLPMVDGGDETSFDIHFGCQKSPIFLLDKPATAAAKFFASSSDAIRLVEMQRRHREKHAEKQREKTRLEIESKQLTAELEALQPAIALDERLKASEALHQVLNCLIQDILELEDEASRIEGQASVVTYHQSQASSLASLAAPPAMHDVQSLLDALEDLERTAEIIIRSTAEHQLLSTLSPPPPFHETADLDSLIVRLENSARTATTETNRSNVLAALSIPPQPGDEQSLTTMVGALRKAEQEVSQAAAMAAACQKLVAPIQSVGTEPLDTLVAELGLRVSQSEELEDSLKQIEKDRTALEQEIRTRAAAEVCPTCGGPLDPEKLLGVPGQGGHSHG